MTVEEIPLIVKTALELVPVLREVPVVGRLLILIAGGHPPSEQEALQALEQAARKKERERTDRKKRNARYVLKASDAMACAEKALMNGKFTLAIGKGLLNVFRNTGNFAPDIVLEEIFSCIEAHELRQDTPRVRSREPRGYRRPARGHGHGRILKR